MAAVLRTPYRSRALGETVGAEEEESEVLSLVDRCLTQRIKVVAEVEVVEAAEVSN